MRIVHTEIFDYPHYEHPDLKIPVVLHKGDQQGYGVSVPDLPGCFSAGDTVTEALDNVQEALALHFEGLVADDVEFPYPQDIDAHMRNPDYSGGIWSVVEFDTAIYLGKAERINITLPKYLLKRIDDQVKRDSRYSSRSGFLASAALRELALGKNE